MRQCSSQTVSITCMPSVTARGNGYWDIIICKWEINGVYHYDTETQATTDCIKVGYTELWNTVKISEYQTTPTNEQSMITKYIDSSVCGR